MKMLNPTPPPVFIIPSNRPRTRSGPDSRGIRICFAELGRSCALKQGYLIFTDGSAYAYDAESNEEVEALCAQLQRGKVFNSSVRRSRGGFVKGFTPPADYQTIYTFPPYEGVAPTACPVGPINWNNLSWTVVSLDPGTPPGTVSVLLILGNTGSVMAAGSAPTSGGGHPNPIVAVSGTLTFNGPMTASNAAITQTNTGAGPALANVTVSQDGVDLPIDGAGNFTLNDTGGMDSAIEVDVTVVGSTGDSDFGESSGGATLQAVLTPAS